MNMKKSYTKRVKRVNEKRLEEEEEVPCKKRQNEDASSFASTQYQPARILGRKYPLTKTGYKYLEIGITVGSASSIVIVLSDNGGHELIFPFASWKALLQKRKDVEQLMKSGSSSASMEFGDLAVKVCSIKDMKLVKFSLGDKYLLMTPKTVTFMLNLKDCINIMHSQLSEYLESVNEKFSNFVNILLDGSECEEIDMYSAASIISASNEFSRKSLVDCELVACALSDIVHEVLNK